MQPERFQQRVLRLDEALAAQLPGQRDAGRDPHAERHGAPVRDPETGRRLQRMAGGVPVVQDRPWAAIPLVLGDDQRLGRDAAEDDSFQHGGVALEQARAVSLQQVEKASVHGDGVLYNLGERIPVIRRRKRFKRRDVRDDCRGLPERANRVLRFPAVDPGLASDARIDHREQRGGDRDQPHPALPDRRRESSQVAHSPAPDRDHDPTAVYLLSLQEPEHVLQLLDRLRALARRDGVDGGLQPGPLDRLGDLHRVRPRVRVGDDRRPRRVKTRDDVAELAPQVGADQDRVAAGRRIEDQTDQSFSTSSASAPAGCLPSTVYVASS